MSCLLAEVYTII